MCVFVISCNSESERIVMCVCVCVCVCVRREKGQLEERLRVLKEEEQRLVREGETGVQLQEQTVSVCQHKRVRE